MSNSSAPQWGAIFVLPDVSYTLHPIGVHYWQTLTSALGRPVEEVADLAGSEWRVICVDPSNPCHQWSIEHWRDDL